MNQSTDAKSEALREHRALHRRPDDVTDELFLTHEFFDPRDLVQVKYEMLRRVQVDHLSVSAAADSFGFSRPSFYQLLAAFEEAGLPGLIAKRRGPKTAHKLTDDVLEYLEQLQNS